MSFCLSTKYFCQVPVLITQRGSINWLSSICLLVGVDCGFTGVGSMQYRTPGRTQNPRWGILRGRWHTEMICEISGQNSSHLTSNVSLSTSTPDPIIWTAFVLNSEKLLRAQLFSFKCSYVTFSLCCCDISSAVAAHTWPIETLNEDEGLYLPSVMRRFN